MWLTAWVASYMTARLARAFLQPGRPTCSGWARMRLPSVSPMVLTMADDSSTSLAGDHADVARRGRRRAVGVAAAGAVDEHRLADLDLVAGCSGDVA